jgi:hypothetical protein
MEKEELRNIVLGALALFAVLYILISVGEKLLASFLAFAGVTALGARIAKYQLQLEVFDAIVYIGILMVASSLIVHFAQLIGASAYLPSALVAFASASSYLEVALMIFAALSYAQHATKPGFYAWFVFLCVFDLIINKNTYANLNVTPYEYLIIGLAVLGIAVGAYLGLKLSFTVFTGIMALLVFFTGVSIAVGFLSSSGLVSVPALPRWFITVSSSALLGMVLYMFIAHLVDRSVSPTPFLAGASIWALSVFGITGLQALINLALFSIAVWILITALGARR